MSAVGWSALAVYLAVGVVAFRSIIRGFARVFSPIDGVDVATAGFWALVWPAAWPVCCLMLRDSPSPGAAFAWLIRWCGGDRGR